MPRADGTRPYAWPDLQAALESFAPGEDWQALHARHVAGTERLTSPRVEGAARAVAAAVAPRCRTVRDRCEGDGPRRRPEALRRAACPWAGRQTPT